ncbi:MAG: hypothetical protein GAK45_00591 [Pseudomonas citronellolis]|nr:MAG: hypothetical protein GAK45_00591 [Pseudomonas citronellolis]
MKILALGFLIMIGMALIADSFGAHVPKGYIYAAMAFSLFIECLNMMQRRRRQKPPVHLRNPYRPDAESSLPAGDDERALFGGFLDYAERHRRVIDRFARFPHRNLVLGRASSAEEAAFLLEPGSRF